jgi:aerobic-type carbon monoxide dehydrogenase small subunit (CoxS/CutS family)
MPNLKKLRLNGRQVDVDAEDEQSLLELLRDQVG